MSFDYSVYYNMLEKGHELDTLEPIIINGRTSKATTGMLSKEQSSIRIGSSTAHGFTGVNDLIQVPQRLSVASTNNFDTKGSTGAEKIRIEGVDENFRLIHEDVELSGNTEVVTSQTFRCVHSARVTAIGTTAGSQIGNSGIISIGTGAVVSGSVAKAYLAIRPERGISEEAAYAVPKGRTLLICDIEVNYLPFSKTAGSLETLLWSMIHWQPIAKKGLSNYNQTTQAYEVGADEYAPYAALGGQSTMSNRSAVLREPYIVHEGSYIALEISDMTASGTITAQISGYIINNESVSDKKSNY